MVDWRCDACVASTRRLCRDCRVHQCAPLHSKGFCRVYHFTYSLSCSAHLICRHPPISLFAFLLLLLLTASAFFMEQRADRILHTNLLRHVMHSPSSFFDTTPLGRILNRFTGDLTTQDKQLVSSFISVGETWFTIVGHLLIVTVDEPMTLSVAAVALFSFVLLLTLYSPAARNCQCLEYMSASPVLSVFSECLSGGGLSTIRTFHLEDYWRHKFHRLTDEWTVRYVIFSEGQKWASLYSSLITTPLLLFMTVVGWCRMESAKLSIFITSAFMVGIYITHHLTQNRMSNSMHA